MIRRVGLIVVVVHALINVAHGIAHAELDVKLRRLANRLCRGCHCYRAHSGFGLALDAAVTVRLAPADGFHGGCTCLWDLLALRCDFAGSRLSFAGW